MEMNVFGATPILINNAGGTGVTMLTEIKFLTNEDLEFIKKTIDPRIGLL